MLQQKQDNTNVDKKEYRLVELTEIRQVAIENEYDAGKYSTYFMSKLITVRKFQEISD